MNNVAHNAPVTAFSSIEDGGWQVAALTDGIKDGIGWSSKAFASFPDHNLYPEWVAIDLGRHHRIDRIDLYPRGDGANAGQGFPRDFTLALCVEGEPWQTVAELKDYPLPKSGEAQSFPIPPHVARYVRIQATRLRSFGGNFHFQMSEVEVFGVPVEAPHSPRHRCRRLNLHRLPICVASTGWTRWVWILLRHCCAGRWPAPDVALRKVPTEF